MAVAKKEKEKLDALLSIPLTKQMKGQIVDAAEAEERAHGEMGRILMREALEARGENKGAKRHAERSAS